MSPSVHAFPAPTSVDAVSPAPSRLPTPPESARPFSEFTLGDADSFEAPSDERPTDRAEPRDPATSAETSEHTLAEADQRRPHRRAKANDEAEAARPELLAWPCAALAISVPAPEEMPTHEGEASISAVTDNAAHNDGFAPPPGTAGATAGNWTTETLVAPTELTPADAASLAGQDAPVADAAAGSTPPITESVKIFGEPTAAVSEVASAALVGRWTPVSAPTGAAETRSDQGQVPPSGHHGTSAADKAVEVKSWFQQDKFAGSPPDRPETGVGQWPANSRDFSSEREARRSDSSHVAPLLADPFRTASEPITTELELPAPLDVPATLTPLIQEQAVRLRHVSLQSLEVVLRPDGQTELHLHLTQHGGQIEATVRCDRGDAEKFGGGWAKLQESLATQGIRLAPLAESSMSSAGDNSRRQPATPQPAPDALAPRWPTAPAKTLLAPSRAPSNPTPLLPALAASRRALESWA